MSDPALTVQTVLTDQPRAWLTETLRYAVLAVNSKDGPPSQSVMWFDLDPDEPDIIVMNTMVRRLKYRQLQADPRVSVLFEDGLTWVAMRVRPTSTPTSIRAGQDPRAGAAIPGRSRALCRAGARRHPHPRREGHQP